MSNTIIRNSYQPPYTHASRHGVKRGTAPTRNLPRKSWSSQLSLASLGVWIGVIAAVATPFYIFGIVVLTAQISRSYHLSYSTAWYAASLVPSIGILGVSLGILKGVWLYLAIQTVLGLFLLRFDNLDRFHDMTLRQYMARYRPSFRDKWDILRTALVAVMVLAPVVLFILEFRNSHDWLRSATTTLNSSWYVLLSMAMVGKKSPKIRVLILFALMYAQAGLTTLTIRGIDIPRLPAVEMNQDATTKIQGQMLNHKDSYWYVLAHDPNRLVAIPDGIAQRVSAPPIPSPIPSATTAAYA